MLVLTRRIGESIMIGDNIEIIVSRINNRQVRISVSAPSEIKIYRKEIYHKINQQKLMLNDFAGEFVS